MRSMQAVKIRINEPFYINIYFHPLGKNITGMDSMPTPDPPQLTSSTYFGMTLDWSSYKNLYKGVPPIYILEVMRHMDQGDAQHINTSDPTLILPILQKYHIVSNSNDGYSHGRGGVGWGGGCLLYLSIFRMGGRR